MSKINKLSILGVRSFDNRRPETIEFHAPLTLIVGYNGSGKTTIIECLKYATTGDLPPNSKGGAFIHDPGLCDEKEVLAQVKLSFKGTSEARMVLNRSLQLTVKKTTRTQKTLDGTLSIIKHGERTVISSRVAELNQLMPQYLGVSKAVLDNVIFCHQDESLWPMSEPAGLKKKFDEIFEAMKYTKAIDNIKKLRKDKHEELKNLRIMEQNDKLAKDRADKAEKESIELSEELDKLRIDVENIEAKAKEAKQKSADAWNHVAKYQGVVESLRNSRSQRDWLQQNVEDIRRGLKERPESDEWLQNEVDKYDERVVVHEERKQQQTKQYESLKNAIESARERLRTKHVEAGRYQEQKANHEQQIEKRKALVKETARNHNIPGFQSELDDMQIHEYLDKISKLFKEQNASVERARRETEKEMQKVQDAIGQLGERKSALHEARNSAKQQIALNDSKNSAIQSEINSIDIDAGGKALLEANIEDLNSLAKKARDDNMAASWDKKINDAQTTLRLLEDENEELNRELVAGTKQAGDLARLDHLKRELKDRQRGLETLTGAHSARLNDSLGEGWRPHTLEADFQSVLEQKRQRVQHARHQRDEISRSYDHTEFSLKTTRVNLQKGEKELEKCTQIIQEKTQVEPEDFVRNLELAQKDRDTLQEDVANFTAMNDWYAGSLRVAKTEKKCRLCARDFQGRSEQQKFEAAMNAHLSKTASDIQRELQEAETDLQGFRDAGLSHEAWLRLSKEELPRLKKEVKRLEQDREKQVLEIEEHDRNVNDMEQAEKDVESLSRPVANILKYSQDIKSFQQQSEDLAAKQKEAGFSRTLEDIQEQLETVSGKARAQRNTITKLNSDRERARAQVSTLELDLSKAEKQLSSANFQLEKKADLERRVDDFKKSSQDHREKSKHLDQQLQDLASRITEEEIKLDDIRRRGSTKEKDLQKDVNRLSDSTHRLRLATQDIQSYIDADGAGKLARSQGDIEHAQHDVTQLEGEQRQIVVEINRISEELRNQQETKRIILDNIKFRRSQQDLEGVKVETTKAAVEDLGRYAGALDKAIMKYHSLKMEEINRIVEELWKRTYQGTDVDTILIRSDDEAAKGNRSYNYRVCMVKSDVEMDMRGRCSAGQRVLASIIIRLALAECFGVNCGLIALDEPTTNLDRDNIHSLAESLHDLIRVRQQQSNFQLIVITHDEDFLRAMKCADFCDNYYRVARNDKQKSIIERQSIAEVL